MPFTHRKEKSDEKCSVEKIQIGRWSQSSLAIIRHKRKEITLGKNNRGIQRHTSQIQLWILPFTGQNSQIARWHLTINCCLFGTTAIFHLCRSMTLWHRHLMRPAQTGRNHSYERQRDNHAKHNASKSEIVYIISIHGSFRTIWGGFYTSNKRIAGSVRALYSLISFPCKP